MKFDASKLAMYKQAVLEINSYALVVTYADNGFEQSCSFQIKNMNDFDTAFTLNQSDYVTNALALSLAEIQQRIEEIEI